MNDIVQPNFKTGALYRGDNLDFLRAFNSETIDLIATDPPFNKGRDFHATPDSLARNASFTDRWTWDDDVQTDWLWSLESNHPKVRELIDSTRFVYGDDLAAFLSWMGVRLLEMHRVLKPTGSLYLHCDPTASHYLKMLLDAIFGRANFRNEIVWRKYSGRKNNAKHKFTTQHDTLFFYVKSDQASFNGVMIPHSDLEISKEYKHFDDDGRRYRLSRGRSYQKTGIQKRIYLDESPGRAVGSLWAEDGLQLNTSSAERVGYPTQKPLALYERIIKASSNEGDIVLDPFAGCATTTVAAQRLNRRWVAMDIWEGAHQIVLQRMRNETKIFDADSVEEHLEPPIRTDGGRTAANPLPEVKKTRGGRKRFDSKAAKEQLLAHPDWDWVCDGCDTRIENPRYFEVDHDVPVSKGGSDDILNLVLICGPCNRTKSNKMTRAELRNHNWEQKNMAAQIESKFRRGVLR